MAAVLCLAAVQSVHCPPAGYRVACLKETVTAGHAHVRMHAHGPTRPRVHAPCAVQQPGGEWQREVEGVVGSAP